MSARLNVFLNVRSLPGSRGPVDFTASSINDGRRFGGAAISVAGCCIAFFLIVCVQCATCRAADERAEPLAGERYYFKRGEKLMMPVTMLGQKFNGMLDTGCTGYVIEDQFRERLGPVIEAQAARTPSGIIELKLYSQPEIVIGHNRTEPIPKGGRVACHFIGATTENCSDDYHIVVGMDYLKQKLLRINFDDSFYEFLQKKEQQDDDQPQRLRFDRGSPYVLGRVSDDGYQSLMIDTGSFVSIQLSSDIFSRLVKKKKIALKLPQKTTSAGITVTKRTGILNSFEIASFALSNVTVIEGNYNAIGLQFLSKFNLEFDFPNREVIFRPGKRIDLPDQRDRSGLQIHRLDGKMFVLHVYPESAAEHASILPNDELIRIDGTSVQMLSLVQIAELFSEPGAMRVLNIRRGEVTETVKLELDADAEPFPSGRAD